MKKDDDGFCNCTIIPLEALSKNYVRVPILETVYHGDAAILRAERNACWRAIQAHYEKLGREDWMCWEAADDSLVPEVPRFSSIGADNHVRTYQGKGLYFTSRPAEIKDENAPKGAGAIAWIREEPDGSFSYFYERNAPIRLESLDEIDIWGKCEVFAAPESLSPAVKPVEWPEGL